MALHPQLPQTLEESSRSTRRMVAATGATFVDFYLSAKGLEIFVAEKPSVTMAAELKRLYELSHDIGCTVTVCENEGSHSFLLSVVSKTISDRR